MGANAATIYGGGASCGKIFSEADDYETGAVHMTYTMGWVSGINMIADVNWKNPPDPQGIWQALLAYCAKNPLSSHRDAIMATYKQISDSQK